MNTDHLPHLNGVVVGVDGSVHADAAARIAADLAAAERRTLSLVHVLAPLEAYYWVRVPANLAGYEPPLRRAAEVELAALTHQLRDLHPDLAIDTHVLLGDARDLLTALSTHAHLVVVGTRGRGMFGPAHIGSVALYLTRHAHSPVLVVRPDSHTPTGRGVLVGVDDTERSLPVLEFAFEAASRQDCTLTILHSDWLFAPISADEGFVPGPQVDEDEVRRLIAEESAGLREKYPDVVVDVVVGHHGADDELLRRAAQQDLIVVGSRSHGAVGEWLLSSVATEVAARATCPVAVVPTRR